MKLLLQFIFVLRIRALAPYVYHRRDERKAKSDSPGTCSYLIGVTITNETSFQELRFTSRRSVSVCRSFVLKGTTISRVKGRISFNPTMRALDESVRWKERKKKKRRQTAKRFLARLVTERKASLSFPARVAHKRSSFRRSLRKVGRSLAVFVVSRSCIISYIRTRIRRSDPSSFPSNLALECRKAKGPRRGMRENRGEAKGRTEGREEEIGQRTNWPYTGPCYAEVPHLRPSLRITSRWIFAYRSRHLNLKRLSDGIGARLGTHFYSLLSPYEENSQCAIEWFLV